MGRIFKTTTPNSPTATGVGRVATRADNANVEPLKPSKAWEDLKFHQKFWATTKEVPRVLFNFLPESTRKLATDIKEDKPLEKYQAEKAGLMFIPEFAKGMAQVTGQAVGGAALGIKEKFTKKPESIKLPVLGEVSSYQKQVGDFKQQGFSDGEAKTLVGINAYLGVMPLVTKGLKTKPGQALTKAITTKEVPFAQTPEGIKLAVKSQEVLKTPETPKAQAVLQKLQESARIERPALTAVKQLFGKKETQVQFQEAQQANFEKFLEGRENILSREDPLNKALLNLSDAELKSYSAVTQGLAEPIKPTPTLKTAVNLWKKVNKDIETDLIKQGRLTLEQVEQRRWKPIEVTTGRNRAQLQDLGVEPIYYPYLATDLLKKSDFLPSARLSKPGFLKRFTGKLLQENNYIKDPKIAIPRNRLQAFRDKMNREFVEDIKNNFGEKDPTIITELKQNPKLAEQLGLEEWKPAGALRFFPLEEGGVGVTTKTPSMWLPKEVVSELNKTFKPGMIEKTLRMTYDPLIDLWRISVLNLSPRWIYNNFVGNAMQSILAKADPLSFGKAAKEMFARTKVGEKLGIEKREIPKEVMGKSYAGQEIPQAGKLGGLPSERTQAIRPIENWLNILESAKNYKLLRVPALATQSIIKGALALGKPGAALNRVVENWFRTALYITKTEGKFLGMDLEKPNPPAEGIKYVNEFLFDYQKLSRTERATFRRALPFWNWTKNISEFAFKYPVKHPIRGLAVGALLQDYVDYINEVNQADNKTKSVLRLKTDMTYEGKPLYLNIRSALPYSDVFSFLPSPGAVGKILTGNPVSKIIMERWLRLNTFTQQPFTQPKEKVEYDEFGKEIRPLPSLARHIGAQVPQTKIIQNLADAYRYGQPLKRFETGEPKLLRGRIQLEDLLMDIGGYFGIKLNPVDYNEIGKSVQRKEKKAAPKAKIYERRIEQQLKTLQQKQNQP